MIYKILNKNNQNFRNDIQALRGIAVLLVVLYHLSIPGFQGGYIGVDIFFVISGYLIIKKILESLINEKFSIKHFFVKRVRRILPLLYFILAITSALSVFIKHPIDNVFFSKSSLSTLLFIPNFFFWKNINYFNPKTELMHLIHTWSLGVEEQTYFFLPFFLIISYKLVKKSNKKILLLFIFVFLSSYSMYFLGYYFQINATFYLFPFRAWEFFIGGIVAILEIRGIKISNKFLDLILIIPILLSASIFNPEIYSHNYFIIFPVLFSALFILNENKSWDEIFIFKILIFFGYISYSFYLIHQPIFVFSRLYGVYDVFKPLVFLAALILSFFTYVYVEEKFRSKVNKNQLFKFLLSCLTITFLFNFYSLSTDGLNQRIIDKYAFNIYERKTNIGISKFGNQDNLRFILYGDSHADHYVQFLEEQAIKNDYGFITVTTSACISLKKTVSFSSGYVNKNCTDAYSKLLEIQSKYSLDIVVAQRWDQSIINPITNQKIENNSTQKVENLYESLLILNETIEPQKLTVVGNVPGSNSQKSGGYFRCKIYRAKDCLIKFSIVDGNGYNVNNVLGQKLNNAQINFLDPYKYLCDSDYCFNEIDEKFVYYDNSHLTKFGSMLVLENNIVLESG